MRNELKKICGQRRRFNGIMVRVGKRNHYRGSRLDLYTILFRDVKDEEGNIVADHLWLDCVPTFTALHPSYGDIVEFEGTVESYIRGVSSRRNYYYTGTMSLDYTIRNIKNSRVIGKIKEEDMEDKLKWYDREENKEIGC